jgi:very-short-patch-repair endonuclease
LFQTLINGVVPLWRGLGEDSYKKNVYFMYNNTHYNRKNQPLAHQLRKDMTKAEACLWKYALKAGQMRSYSFRRQRPVLDFIVDFICIPLKLVIEVDGYSHFLDGEVLKDKIKEKALKEAGYTIIRFTDNQVLKDIHNVIAEIEKYIENLERMNSSKIAEVHPQPPYALT